MKVSVALAAYRGEKYISTQLDSILPQLSEGDELIVSDDKPGGETQRIVEGYAARDPRVRHIPGPGKGVCANFANAISHCTGDVIFLCDQDDFWLPGKVEACSKAIEQGAVCVLHNAKLADADLQVTDESFFAVHGSKTGFLRNCIRNSFMGCCMAFDASLKSAILPFPDNIPMHDQWIGLLALKAGKVVFLEEPYLLYRRHGGNVTGNAPVSKMQQIKWRLSLAKALLRYKNPKGRKI